MAGLEAENLVRATLVSCFNPVPFVEIGDWRAYRPLLSEGQSGDFRFTVRLSDGRTQTLLVEYKSSGEPRVARAAVNQLLSNPETPDTYRIFVAPYISPRAAEICASANIGYADLAGNCRLCFDAVYIERQGRPNPYSRKRSLRSLYSPKATRVLRVLLADARRKWKLKELATEAKVSLGLVSNVKTRLLNREWAESSSEGLFLIEPEALLREWAANYDSNKNKRLLLYTLRDLSQIEQDIAAVCRNLKLRCALTSFSAAARMAGAVRYRRASAFVQDPAAVAADLDAKRVDTGWNLSLMEPYDNGVFYAVEMIDDIPVASAVQVYLDLSSSRERGNEAADAILERSLKANW